ncbi:MAG: TetR/AcrR family transcriptional regulator [Pseudomonadota bacterium]
MAKPDKVAAIISAAENMVRDGGYNSFSFRTIADEVGIKSASVHYHFPTKEDLGIAVAEHYTDRFMAALGDPVALVEAGKNPIDTYIAAFRAALEKDKKMCLCGLLGAEARGLPDGVVEATRTFFKNNVAWLTTALVATGRSADPETEAYQIVALLEGALITANVLDDITAFDKAVARLAA